jgi:phi13 family phage major tail protein
MTTNNKSFVGVDNIYYALVTQDDANGYVAGTPAPLAPAMTITQTPKTNSKVQYADNQPFDSMVSEGETEMDVEITGIMLDALATVLGKPYDLTNGQMSDNGGTPPDIALGFRAKRRPINGVTHYRYYWFLKGTFQTPVEEQSTETDTPDPKSTKMKFVAIRTIHQFALPGSITDSVKRQVGDTSDPAFTTASTWFNDVRVPVVGSPSALTCTPSPADAATGVAVSVSPTLTFNNALRTGVSGISLVSVAGVVIAAAITIDADNKVVTINPNSNLSASTQYLIVVSGARDVFGQALALTAYDFTTA